MPNNNCTIEKLSKLLPNAVSEQYKNIIEALNNAAFYMHWPEDHYLADILIDLPNPHIGSVTVLALKYLNHSGENKITSLLAINSPPRVMRYLYIPDTKMLIEQKQVLRGNKWHFEYNKYMVDTINIQSTLNTNIYDILPFKE